ncbi:hypothetical protein JK162_07875 [Leuconostoc pseudomesenteroides]|jgi:hypothetical protein|uniref:hypothetical protein n=1 Tax=Leuconostoc TaxID=1243 RepID=UPI0011DCFA87|nr:MULTISPECIES: hypothetical protein [Leuconostoc]MBK0040355.1 hypothetical protein [Leuconostoc sp. S51]MBK0051261.1 hypothetical protein [Leuconostoc sp. S50]MBS0958400.1 hypothetical protein [Leuconostoc pseudomesenteroides]MCT4381634.1 hypothetical protein [Leuconostoc pseudomesenteroides]MCT4413336.1 hypothetical protein [Leuconostoc pseudomesenteroides]
MNDNQMNYGIAEKHSFKDTLRNIGNIAAVGTHRYYFYVTHEGDTSQNKISKNDLLQLLVGNKQLQDLILANELNIDKGGEFTMGIMNSSIAQNIISYLNR